MTIAENKELMLTRPHLPLRRRIKRWFPLLLAGLTLLVYFPLCHYPLINLADARWGLENPLLHGLSAMNIKTLFFPGANPVAGGYAPIPYLLFAVETACFGLNPTEMHTFSLILHVINVLLVYTLALRFLRHRTGAFVAALLFACHPVQVEAVAWIMGRRELLGCLFSLLALHALDRQCRRPSARLMLAIFLAALAAMLSQPMAFILPLIFAVWVLEVRGRIMLLDLPLLVGTLIMAAVFFQLSVAPEANVRVLPSLIWRLAAVPVAGAQWFSRLLLLSPCLPIYSWPNPLPTDTRHYTAAGFILVMSACCIPYFRRLSRFRFALLFTLVAALPAALMVIRFERVVSADCYGYFPLIGLFLALGGLIPQIPRQYKQKAYPIGGALLAILLVFAHFQVEIWRSRMALWETVLRARPQSTMAKHKLGVAWIDAGQLHHGIAIFRDILETNPNNQAVRLNLGQALLKISKPRQALAVLRACPPDTPGLTRIRSDALRMLAQQNTTPLSEHSVIPHN